jgi:hypothetical protein
MLSTPIMNPNPELHLHLSQQRAIAQLRNQASLLRPNAISDITEILRMCNLPPSDIDFVLASIRQYACIALHFHPDRPVGPRTVSRSLLEDGIYKSQFETGISNGHVSAHQGGARDEWERSLFNGAYNVSGVDPTQRPKYGALDLMQSPDGPAPRFGSCFFILKPEVSARSTFTFGGSQAGPKYQGTLDEFHLVLDAIFEECYTRDFALGVSNIRPAQLAERLRNLEKSFYNTSTGCPSRNLDHFIEAQVHGEVLLSRDVKELVADPSFRGSETGQDLEDMSRRFGFTLRWHRGFRIKAVEVPLNFRGPTMRTLAERVARDGFVDAEAIGSGVRELTSDKKAWRDRGTYEEVLQELKLLWHVLVRFGDEIGI